MRDLLPPLATIHDLLHNLVIITLHQDVPVCFDVTWFLLVASQLRILRLNLFFLNGQFYVLSLKSTQSNFTGWTRVRVLIGFGYLGPLCLVLLVCLRCLLNVTKPLQTSKFFVCVLLVVVLLLVRGRRDCLLSFLLLLLLGLGLRLVCWGHRFRDLRLTVHRFFYRRCLQLSPNWLRTHLLDDPCCQGSIVRLLQLLTRELLRTYDLLLCLDLLIT